jgi:hypothetical protein
MLDVTDRDYVKTLILARIRSDPSPRQTLINALPDDIVDRLEEGLTPQVLVERVLVLCEQDGWNRAPSALSTLVMSMVGNIGRVPDILGKLASPPRTSAANPFMALVLDTGQPFLDRLTTRNVLRSWTSLMPLKQVMVIEGPSRTGKTYTNEFVRHIVRHVTATAPDVRTAMVSFDRDQATSTGPLELATDLVGYMGGDLKDAPAYDTNSAALIKQLVAWVLGHTNRQGFKWWFVLDGYRSSRAGEQPAWQLRDDTRDFIVAFVKVLTSGDNAARHRLLLLDFDRALLPLAPGAVGLDKTCPVPRASVRSVIEAIVTSAGSQLDPAAAEAEILSGLPDPIADLSELNARLSDLLTAA